MPFTSKRSLQCPCQPSLLPTSVLSFRIYDQLKYIAHDGEEHVLYLEADLKAAGAQPVAACTYSFPMTTPQEFVELAAAIEGLGVSAYLGTAPEITSKACLAIAGSTLVIETIRQASQRNAISEIAVANVFGTPLGLNAVYTIASAFIKSCPSSNAVLPAMTYPSLMLISGQPTSVGAIIELRPKTEPMGDLFSTFVRGLDVVAVQIQGIENGTIMVEVPVNISREAYAFLTKDNSLNITDDNILFGPTVIEVTPGSPNFDLKIM